MTRTIRLLTVCALLGAILGCSGSPGGDSGATAAARETRSTISQKDEPPMGDRPAKTAENQTAENQAAENQPAEDQAAKNPIPESVETATFGAGCFWCVEAVLQQLNGVKSVTSGYMGGRIENPTYKQICTGQTGHAEVAQVTFDPRRIRYEDLLIWFWKLHDPTTLNRQGNDVGTQYRSVIFTHSAAQKAAAEASRKAADASGAFDAPIVTEISTAGVFYPAEGYHQDYYQNNKDNSYCQFVISPKLDKLGLDD